MYRRPAAVCLSVVVLLLGLAFTSAASASRKSAVRKRPGTARTGNQSTASLSRATGSCSACAAAEKAKKRRGSSTKKARTAKSLPCHPKHYLDPRIAKNYKAALREMRRAGIEPRVTSVWRSSATQAQLHRCSLSSRCRRSNPGLYRALPAGTSIHEAGFAVDIAGVATGPRGAKRLTPQGRRIVAIMQKHGFKWRYGLADPVHFEADPRKHGYRSVREAIARTQTTCQVKLAKGKASKKRGSKIATSRARVPGKARLSAQRSSNRTKRFTSRATA
jgi:hypothetical protein